MTQPATFTECMTAAKAFAEKHHIEWYELRGAVIRHQVERFPEMYKDQGIGSSDGNNMIVSAVRNDELEEICRDLVTRGTIINSIVAGTGKTPAEALEGLRAFFAPA